MNPRSLRCDNCGAALRPAPHLPTVECDHCHQVILLRPAVSTVPPRARGRVGVVGAGVLLACGMAAAGLAARRTEAPRKVTIVATSSTTSISTSTSTSSTTTIRVEAPPPPPWRELARFGEPGTGAGQFTSPRHIAVAPDGDVFVAEASTGRVHRFDAAGRFEQLYTVTPSRLTRDVGIFGIAAGPDGVLWVNRGGDLVAFDPAGRVVRTVTGDYPDTWFHGGLGVDATGAVVAVTDRTGTHDAVRLSPSGKILTRLRNTGARDLAVDGLGGVVLARRDGVDVLAPDGALRARFGQLSPGAVALDARGRILVADGGKLAVFEPDGRRAATLAVPSFVDLAVAPSGGVYLLGHDRVVHIDIRPSFR